MSLTKLCLKIHTFTLCGQVLKLHEKFTLIYDPNDPAEVCAERYALKDAVSDFVLFALLEAGILGAAICMFIFLS